MIPQTSGGLLVSIEKSDAEQCLEELKALGLPCAIVGEVTEKREKKNRSEIEVQRT